jgi:predicted RNase H-like nuclease (RuvC/YqgF family)
MSYAEVNNSSAGFAQSPSQAAPFSNCLTAPTLKGKINALEETVRVLADEIEFYAGEIKSLKQEKDEFETALAVKPTEIRNTMLEEIAELSTSLKSSHHQQK